LTSRNIPSFIWISFPVSNQAFFFSLSIDDIPSCNPHFGLGGSGDLRRVALLTFLLNAHRRKLSPAYEEPRRLPGSGGGGGGGEMKRNEKERCTRKRKRRRRRRTNRAAKRMMKKYYHRMHTSIRFFGK
jgi:hypothetical protein